MSAPALSLAAVRRRYVGLTALRWLPVGISTPVVVLLASSRGLTAADVGLVFAVHSVVALLLELPTGGLADAIGHRPVLVLSVVLHAAGLLTMVAAHSVVAFAAAYALIGAGRALDSGPLESWFVDAAHSVDAHADLTPGLSRASAADGAGLALGAVVGGLAPTLAAGVGSAALALPILLATAVDVVYLLAVLALVVPLGSAPGVSTGAALRGGFREVPRVLTGTGAMVRGDVVLRRLLLIGVLTGVVLSTLELLGPLRFSHLAGDPTRGTAVFGVVTAVSFGAAALGAAVAGPVRRALRGSTGGTTATLGVLAAVAIAATALSPAVLPAAVAYALFYLAAAAAIPLRQQLLHSRVPAERRSTTISVVSFAVMIGGVAGSLLVPRLAEATSATVGFLAAAGALVGLALISLRLPTPPTAVPAAGGAQRSNAVG